MKYKFFLKLFIPIVIGMLLGYVCAIFNIPIFVRIMLTISSNILILIKVITPFLLVVITATALSSIKEKLSKKVLFLLKLFGYIVLTLIVLGVIVFALSFVIVPFLTFDFQNYESTWLSPLFELKIPALFSNSYLSLISIVIGIILGLFLSEENIIIKFCAKLQNYIFLFFSEFLTPIMPLWIIGSFSSTTYSNVGVNFILTDFLLSIYILILQFSWLFIMYFVTSKLFNVNFKKMYNYGLQIYFKIVSISGFGTQAIIPFIIEKEVDLGFNEQKSTIITATSFNMPGSLISNIVFVLGVINLFNFDISFFALFSFVFILILATIIAPSFPGGTAAITSTLTASILGFSEDMNAIFYTMYYKQGISNSATNNAADLYISSFFKKD